MAAATSAAAKAMKSTARAVGPKRQAMATKRIPVTASTAG
jgi:hypothetical protein